MRPPIMKRSHALALAVAAVLAFVVSQGCGTSTGRVKATFTPSATATNAPAGAATSTAVPNWSATTSPTLTRGWHLWPTTTPIPTADLWGVKMTGSTSGWVVGSGGTLLAFSGTGWQPYGISLSTNDLYSVSFGTTTIGWIVGASGTILRFNGGIWTSAPTPMPTA